MRERSTSSLDNLLETVSKHDLKKLIEENAHLCSLSEYLNKILKSRKLKKSEVIKESLLDRTYAYQIFNGEKQNPTRDKVIALCLALHMNLKETQRALKLCNSGILYSKNTRDAVIIYSINNEKFNIIDLNVFLDENNLEPLNI